MQDQSKQGNINQPDQSLCFQMLSQFLFIANSVLFACHAKVSHLLCTLSSAREQFVGSVEYWLNVSSNQVPLQVQMCRCFCVSQCYPAVTAPNVQAHLLKVSSN